TELDSLQEEYNNAYDEFALNCKEVPIKNIEMQSEVKIKKIQKLKKDIYDLTEEMDAFEETTSFPNSDSEFPSDEYAKLISLKILDKTLEEKIRLEEESIEKIKLELKSTL